MKNIIDISKIKNRYTYEEYKNLSEELVEQQRTTGPSQSENLIEYTKLNYFRMARVDKTMVIKNDVKEAIQSIDEKKYWILITEAWCGDAAQIVPIIGRLAELNSNIELLIVLRDENLELMDKYLTNGGRSIPILISLNKNFKEEWHWGPRPRPAQAMVIENKETQALSFDEMKKQVQLWYAEDKTNTTQLEIMKKIKQAAFSSLNNSVNTVEEIKSKADITA
ncbi:MAG: thioredoxin family protein [Bacteroidetes bacterium]|nr:thioredoxin family protein [Bacteroidota bacterium]